MDLVDAYACVCPAHYVGRRCETARDSRCDVTASLSGGGGAATGPCLNGGTCVDLRHAAVDDFRCRCPPGFVGRLCEQNAAGGCSTRPCANGATCHDLVDGSSFVCSCPTGYAGHRCNETLLGSCVSGPCRHGATCVDLRDGGVLCLCATTGKKSGPGRAPCGDDANSTYDVISGAVESGAGDGGASVVFVDASSSSSLTAAELVLVAVLGGGLPVAILAVILVAMIAVRRRHSSAAASIASPRGGCDVTNNRHVGDRIVGGEMSTSGHHHHRHVTAAAAPGRCVKMSNVERQRMSCGRGGGEGDGEDCGKPVTSVRNSDTTRWSLNQPSELNSSGGTKLLADDVDESRPSLMAEQRRLAPVHRYAIRVHYVVELEYYCVGNLRVGIIMVHIMSWL